MARCAGGSASTWQPWVQPPIPLLLYLTAAVTATRPRTGSARGPCSHPHLVLLFGLHGQRTEHIQETETLTRTTPALHKALRSGLIHCGSSWFSLSAFVWFKTRAGPRCQRSRRRLQLSRFQWRRIAPRLPKALTPLSGQSIRCRLTPGRNFPAPRALSVGQVALRLAAGAPVDAETAPRVQGWALRCSRRFLPGIAADSHPLAVH